MTRRHIYFGIENLNLSAEQRGALVEVLRALGPAHSGQPCRLCHWRTRLDNEAAIYEALFDEDTITVQAFKSRLGNIFDVSPSTIDHSTNQVTLDSRQTAVATFSRSGVDYLKVAFFGYAGGEDWPTWRESLVETLAYLEANREEWEEDV
jgi:hypothetical protein